MEPMAGKICLVTGATSGIGAATAIGLAQRGATVIVVGRNPQKGAYMVNKIKSKTGNSLVKFMLADLSSQKEIHRLAEEFKNNYQRLDVLVNNAGAKFICRQEAVDGYEMTFALNHLAYFLLTNLMIEPLRASGTSRIINISSSAHAGCSMIKFDDVQFKKEYMGKQAYAHSKLANVLFTYELARRLKGTVVTVNAVHPGGVITKFCKNNGWISWAKHVTAHLLARNLIGPIEGAKTSVYLATSPDVEGVSGKYFSNLKAVRSSNASYDENAAKRLWEVSLEMTGLSVSF
ncbi:MAG: short-chain dehydrogenase [Planctomycetes bacterium RBG_16_41_13]|nr:MAG: short-chain dehydrogenase [Planctomycetes bacterium RBG_16_41_13]